MSTLLYPPDVDHTDDILSKQFQLDKRRDLFEAVSNAITKLGMDNALFSVLPVHCSFIVVVLA